MPAPARRRRAPLRERCCRRRPTPAGHVPRAVRAGGAAPTDEETHFLPNFCRGAGGRSASCVIAELLAIVITLVTRRTLRQPVPGPGADLAVRAVGRARQCRRAVCRTPLPQPACPTRARSALPTCCCWRCWSSARRAVWVLWARAAGSAARAPGMVRLLPHPELHGRRRLSTRWRCAIFLARHQLRQRTLSEARAQVEALRSRIRPHFLFNTMNIIASLIRSAHRTRPRPRSLDMADLFCASMLGESERPGAGQQRDRRSPRSTLRSRRCASTTGCAVDWDIGKFPRKAAMPVLLLQPLLENAIHHGVEPNSSGGVIGVRLWEEGDVLHIAVTNSLPRTRSKGGMAHAR
ncbi:MAG: histidine kinase [Chromatiales bacterium]|nr:histidine kinase [Chromatiales bacterium]